VWSDARENKIAWITHAAQVNVKILNKQVRPLWQPVPFEAIEKLGRYLSGNAWYLI
jgi:hypothetical protein